MRALPPLLALLLSCVMGERAASHTTDGVKQILYELGYRGSGGVRVGEFPPGRIHIIAPPGKRAGDPGADSIYIRLQHTPPEHQALIFAMWRGSGHEKEEVMIRAWNREHEATKDGHCMVSATEQKESEGDHSTEMHMRVFQPLDADRDKATEQLSQAVERAHSCVKDYHAHIKEHFESYQKEL
eukprot:TRINITY_DN71919_c0_g1_i1.p2 TRINITY_DN71919_c0_g1~~TRINITY_DN71919_c0_g1_i1.p2  ORF type:complete len:208 (+),score=77.82 TRINITY_DN71919_c0_g1_i1:75-626(+)